MRKTLAVFMLLWGTAAAFTPHASTNPALLRPVTQTVALNAWNNDEIAEYSKPLALPAMTILSASLLLFAPLPPIAEAAVAQPEMVVEKTITASVDQKAVIGAKNALDEYTKKFAAAQKVLKEAQALDDKALSAVDAAEKKLDTLRKKFIAENDKLAKAKVQQNDAQVAALSKSVGMYIL